MEDAKIPGIPGQLQMERARRYRFCLCRIGTGMTEAVAFEDPPGILPIQLV